jgi:outer membrane receptor for ferrienterochelin and colicin
MGLFTCAIAVSSVSGAQPAQVPGTDDLSLADLMSITIVTASKEAEPINEAPGVISTLSRDEIDRLGPASLREILTTIPGISASSGYLFDRSSIAVQGDMSKQNTSHVLILINGRPIREVLEGGLSSDILAGFPTSAIDHIEVIKGPGSVLYGSDAFTGVINIVTRKPSEDEAKVILMTTPDGGRRGDAEVSMASGDLKISQSATYDREDQINTGYIYKNPATGTITTLPIHFAPTGYGAHTQLDYREFNAFVGYDQNTSFSQVRGFLGNVLMEKTYGNVGYSHAMTEWWTVSVNTGITAAELKDDNFPYAKRSSYEALAEVTNNLKIGEGKVVVGGLADYRDGQETYWTSGQYLNKANYTGYSGYTQASYPVIQPVQLIGGMQYNQVPNLKPGVAPRAGAIWAINDELSVKALWSNAFRAPSLNELSLNAPTNIGNSKLKPESIETYDLAFSFNGHGFYSSVNAFYSNLTDIIADVPTSQIAAGLNTPVLQYQNTDNFHLMGAGCELKGYITKAWLVSGSANYQEPYNDNHTWDMLPIPLYTGKLGTSYVSPQGWEAGMSTILQGDYSAVFTTDKLNPAPESSIQTDLNAKLSLARWLKLHGKQDLALRAQVKNLFNEYRSIPEWGGTTQDALPDLRGRSFYLGMDMQI